MLTLQNACILWSLFLTKCNFGSYPMSTPIGGPVLNRHALYQNLSALESCMLWRLYMLCWPLHGFYREHARVMCFICMHMMRYLPLKHAHYDFYTSYGFCTQAERMLSISVPAMLTPRCVLYSRSEHSRGLYFKGMHMTSENLPVLEACIYRRQYLPCWPQLRIQIRQGAWFGCLHLLCWPLHGSCILEACCQSERWPLPSPPTPRWLQQPTEM